MKSDRKQDPPRSSAPLSRRQFLKGSAAAAVAGAATAGSSGCAYRGPLKDDYPLVPENRVHLPPNGKSVLILGGGFGGMHAACELLDRGFEVRVIEKSNLLGGKLKSWRDKKFGVPPGNDPDWKGYPRDAGIHGVWGCYNNLREFMGRHDYRLFRFPNEATSFYNFLDRDGTNATMLDPPPGWPGLLGDLQRYLDMTETMETMSGEKIGLSSYLLKMMSFDFDDQEQRMYLDSLSFPEWARSVGMPEGVIYRIMGPFADMAMFDHIDDTSALYVLVMMQLLFGSYGDMCIDLFTHPVGETYVASLEEYITSRGGEILYDTPVVSLNRGGDGIESVLAGGGAGGDGERRWRCRVCGEDFPSPSMPDTCPICGASSDQIFALEGGAAREYTADYYIVAMDTPGAKNVIGGSGLAGDPYFDRIMKMDKTSVYIVDIWYPACRSWEKRFPGHWDFMQSGFEYLGFTLNWAVDGRIRGEQVTAPYVREYQPDYVSDDIAVIETQIADTPKVEGLSDEEIVGLVHGELKSVMPDLPDPASFYVNRWDTYSPQRPGYEAIRPEVQSPIDNLLFVGDWVKTDHQSVYMEKTVVSSRQAVNLLLHKEGQDEGRMKILKSGTPNRIIDTCRALFSVYPDDKA